MIVGLMAQSRIVRETNLDQWEIGVRRVSDR
jgi:hypothetical protein